MDQHETLAGASASGWSGDLSSKLKDRLIMGGLAFGGALTLAWMVILVMLAWNIWGYVV